MRVVYAAPDPALSRRDRDRRKSFFYVRAYSRRFTTLHELERPGNEVRVDPDALPDLLMHFLLNVAPGSDTAARRHVDLELEALSGRRASRGCSAGPRALADSQLRLSEAARQPGTGRTGPKQRPRKYSCWRPDPSFPSPP